MHLMQSRFVTLHDADRRELHFADMAADDDPSLINDQLVVTIDAQLFYSVLNALPYLVNYPYECTEQTLNRFLSTGIVGSLFDQYPAVERMAQKLAVRETRFEAWEADDPNRGMELVETPWLEVARGGGEDADDLINVLDPKITRAQRDAALAKLKKSQTSIGAFPWFPGGPPSPWMTLYILYGFSKGLEFGVEAPKEVTVRAWAYMHRHYIDEWVDLMMGGDCCWETITFLNYTLSNYPDESWTGGVFTADDRQRMLDFSFRHWKQHSPLTKGYLALTLERAGRHDDAVLVFDSVMDSAKNDPDLGTYWAPEDRAWLWYNDTTETHAFALRTLTELEPDDGRRHGLVHWLLLNKKLNHWKSTRATAEVLYSLAYYLRHEDALAVREEISVAVGPQTTRFVFEPDEYTGGRNRVIVTGDKINPKTMSTIVVEKPSKGFAFASATWHFSTERLPAEARGDLLAVERSYFRRFNDGSGWVLRPLTDGEEIAVGDQIEVRLSIRAKHAAEYIHLRDPRGAGFEPETLHSQYSTRSTSGTSASPGTRRFVTRAQTSSSSGCRQVSTPSNTGSAPTWRAPSGSARRSCSPCTHPSSPPTPPDTGWRSRRTDCRPPSAVSDRGHEASANVSSESKLSSEPSTSSAARLRRAGGLHSGGPTPSSSIFPAPTPRPPALGKPRRAGPAATFREVGVKNGLRY